MKKLQWAVVLVIAISMLVSSCDSSSSDKTTVKPADIAETGSQPEMMRASERPFSSKLQKQVFST